LRHWWGTREKGWDWDRRGHREKEGEGQSEDVCPRSLTDTPTRLLARVHYRQGGSFLTSLFSTCLFQRWRDYQTSITNSNSSSSCIRFNSNNNDSEAIMGMSHLALVSPEGRTKAS
jgi:hypothetical protein